MRADLPAGTVIRGTAAGIDTEGRLIVRTPDGEVAVERGDDLYLRLLQRGTMASSGPPVPAPSCHHERMVVDPSSSGQERSVLLLHPHWKVLLGPVIFGVLVLVAAIMVVVVIPAGSSAGMARLVTVALAAVLLLIGVVRPVLRWKTTTYELTTARLRLREGIVSRTGRDIPLARISDVSFSRSLLDRLLGAGRLLVESPGEHGQIVLSDIPAVERVQAILFGLVEEEQRRLAGEDR